MSPAEREGVPGPGMEMVYAPWCCLSTPRARRWGGTLQVGAAVGSGSAVVILPYLTWLKVHSLR
ncbi:MAG: hypothetical protein Q4A92_04915 [Corynebacterium sp.]|nr:hypothetical protein [Corynebacterium sp.]